MSKYASDQAAKAAKKCRTEAARDDVAAQALQDLLNVVDGALDRGQLGSDSPVYIDTISDHRDRIASALRESKISAAQNRTQAIHWDAEVRDNRLR